MLCVEGDAEQQLLHVYECRKRELKKEEKYDDDGNRNATREGGKEGARLLQITRIGRREGRRETNLSGETRNMHSSSNEGYGAGKQIYSAALFSLPSCGN